MSILLVVMSKVTMIGAKKRIQMAEHAPCVLRYVTISYICMSLVPLQRLSCKLWGRCFNLQANEISNLTLIAFLKSSCLSQYLNKISSFVQKLTEWPIVSVDKPNLPLLLNFLYSFSSPSLRFVWKNYFLESAPL